MFGIKLNPDYDEEVLSGGASVKLAETARKAAEEQSAKKATVDILGADFVFKFKPDKKIPRLTLTKQANGKRFNRGVGHAKIILRAPNRGPAHRATARYHTSMTDDEIEQVLWDVLTEAMEMGMRNRWSMNLPI